MREDLVELVAIIDESGSMGPIVSDTIGGFNSFVEDQKKEPGFANLSLFKFNSFYTQVYVGRDIREVPKLTKGTYHPGGSTALLDTVGYAIKTTGNRLRLIPEAQRPSKVLFLIITDGHENCSRMFTKEAVATMIAHQQEKYNWNFIYMGADMASFDDAAQLNVSYTHTCTASPINTQFMYANLSNKTKAYRSARGVAASFDALNFTDQDKEELNKTHDKTS